MAKSGRFLTNCYEPCFPFTALSESVVKSLPDPRGPGSYGGEPPSFSGENESNCGVALGNPNGMWILPQVGAGLGYDK